MNIQCGSSPDRMRRAGIRTIILLALGVWFAYDGWIGYPHQIRQEYSQQFSQRPDPDAIKIHPEVNAAFVDQLDKSSPLSDAEKRLGPPDLRNDLDARWFGPYGTLVIPSGGGPPSFLKPVKHGATDVLVQRAIATALLLGFVISAVAMLRVRSKRYTLDDRGLTLPGSDTIAWDAMQRLDGDRIEEKGWVELHYAEAGQPKTARLDPFEIERFGEIIDAICERKGFENPLPVKSS